MCSSLGTCCEKNISILTCKKKVDADPQRMVYLPTFRMVHVGRYNIRSVLTEFETVEHYKYPYYTISIQ